MRNIRLHFHTSKLFGYCSPRKNSRRSNGNDAKRRERKKRCFSEYGNISSYRIMKFLGRRNKIDCLISEVCRRLKNTYGPRKNQLSEMGKYGREFVEICAEIMQCKQNKCVHIKWGSSSRKSLFARGLMRGSTIVMSAL